MMGKRHWTGEKMEVFQYSKKS